MKDIQRILIVNDDRKVAARLAARLKIAGYSTAVAANVEGGNAQMTNEPPALLIAGVRLAAYNGLHLIIRGRLDDPRMAAILISDLHDPLLEAEAARQGAAYISRPEDDDRFLSLVAQVLSQDRSDPTVLRIANLVRSQDAEDGPSPTGDDEDQTPH